MDVIVTDHHIISDIPSDAVAVINPKRPACCSGL
jgi:single-stranded DNA-specific DHH superfamily exonuclease